jgi:Zn-dependent peptidase ImmA (M78 family)
MSSWESRISNARDAANQLLTRFGVESAEHVNIEGFVQRLDVHLVDAPLKGATAQLVVSAEHASIILSDRIVDPGERRWAIAHELGHYMLEHPAPPPEALLGPHPQSFLAECPDNEMEADCFALSVLTPERIARKFCNLGPMTLEPAMLLARACGVSLEASAIRIAELTSRACAVVASNRDGILWVAPSSRFVEAFGASLAPGNPLSDRTIAAHHLKGENVSRRSQLVPCAAWLGSAGRPLFEHTCRAARPGTVLTMLWAPHRDAHERRPRVARTERSMPHI